MSETTQESTGAMTAWTRSHRLFMATLAHALLFALCWLLAFGLAYNFTNFQQWFGIFFLKLLPIVVIIKLAVFWQKGLFRGSWRYVSLRDVASVTFAAWLSFFIFFALYYGMGLLSRWNLVPNPFEGQDFPDSVLLLDFAGCIALVSGARLAVRLYHEEVQPVLEGAAPKLLILGAGNAGENVVREMNRQPVLQYRIIGFLDDDQSKWGATIHGLPVLGGIDRIKAFCAEHAIDEILIAMPSATKAQIRRVVELAQGTNLRFKTLPAIADLVAGRAQVQQIRDVDINDVLGRAPVQLDTAEIGKFIKDRVVMVTGAGGSIGSEMCRQICSFRPKRLLLVEQAEQNLFEIDRELKTSFPDLTFIPCIADITDAGRMTALCQRERPSAIIHAAAHKHVPMMEFNPGEAIKNNVRGTMTVANVAAETGVEKFVMISTDKAVNPTSIMGGSKRLAEMYIQAMNDRVATEFITVRFGNVLGSSGSVIPIFKDQIRKGGPVTVTHPDMVRYFMTIPEAAQLVLQAASMGHGGEIYVLDMGEPVKIVDLARDLITLSGFRPGEDIEIKFTGMRPGEKLFEELSIEGEDVSRTAHPKIGVWCKKPEDWNSTVSALQQLIQAADTLDRDTLRERMKALVPEFHLETPAAPKRAATATDGSPTGDGAANKSHDQTGGEASPGIAAA